MKAWTQKILAACGFAALLAGCGQSPAPTSEAPKAPAATTEAPKSGTAAATTPAGKKFRLAFVTNNASDFWTIAKAGCEKAKEDLGNITYEFVIPGDGSSATQQRNVEDLLVKGIDGIAISPIDPTNQTQLLNDVASKALLITQDSDAPASNRACYIGTDNHAAGVQAGEQIKKALPNGGKIMLFVGNLDAQNAKDRKAGIEEALKNTPNITIVDTRTDDTDRGRAKSNPQDAMISNPDLACLVGLYSYNGPAIVAAVKESNKVGKIKIVCFDEEADTLQAVKDGIAECTIVQQPYQFGYQSMKIMAAYLGGDKSVIPASKRIVVETKVIDKTNVDDFWANLKKLTGKE